MNDIVKANIKSRLENALVKENLSTNEAAALLLVKAPYLSIIKNPENWNKCGIAVWETILTWVNSGQGIREFAEKHGRKLCEKPDKENLKEAVTSSEVKKEDVPVEKIKSKPVVNKKLYPVKPEEKVVKRLSAGEMVDLLLEEKAELRAKIDAIDVLLKHYIS